MVTDDKRQRRQSPWKKLAANKMTAALAVSRRGECGLFKSIMGCSPDIKKS